MARREKRKQGVEVLALEWVIVPLTSKNEVHLVIFIQANSIKCVLQRGLISDFSPSSLSQFWFRGLLPLTFDSIKAFYLLSMPLVSSSFSILPSKILSFKGYSILWRLTSEFWAWVTTLHDLNPAKTCSLRWTTFHSPVFQPHPTTDHCPHMTFPLSTSVLLTFGKWGKCPSLPYLLNSYASCNVQLMNCSVYSDHTVFELSNGIVIS